MIPWQVLDRVRMPGSDQDLLLYQRGREFSIRVGGRELMNSRRHGSEDVLADLACAKIAGHPRVRVLIGGLGMGYTLAAALRQLRADSLVVVAELVPAVVAWNQGPLSVLAGHPLQDRRVIIRIEDVARILKTEHKTFDAILLDIDNGPEDLIRKANDWHYTRAGLEAAFGALRPGGVLAIWSTGSNRTFSRRLRRTGFEVEEVEARARGPRGGGHHMIWIASRGS